MLKGSGELGKNREVAGSSRWFPSDPGSSEINEGEGKDNIKLSPFDLKGGRRCPASRHTVLRCRISYKVLCVTHRRPIFPGFVL